MANPQSSFLRTLLDSFILNLPFQAWAQCTRTRFGPLHPRRSGSIHIKSQCLLVHKVTSDAIRTGVDAQNITPVIQQIPGEFTTADIMSSRTRNEFFKTDAIVCIEGGQYLVTAS